MELTHQVLLWGLAIALVMGVVVSKTGFCTMGAVSDWVNIGDTGRMRSWVLAIAVAIVGITLLDSVAVVDMTLVNSGDTGKPPYATPQFVWLRYVLGGLLFGVGMTLGSGCGNKTMVRIGGGNVKSVVVFFAMGVAAYAMIYTDFGYHLFLRWMQPLAINFANYGIDSQNVAALLAGALGFEGAYLRPIIGIVLGALLLSWVFKSVDLRAKFDNVLGGLVVGIAVVAAWFVTAGPLGQTLLEEIEFLDVRPYDAGAQSLTFVKPTAHFYHFIQQGFALNFLSFALVAATGVILGSFIYSAASRKFRIEWFASFTDFARHLVGGLLMGVGGVLSLGCTFGQAITGASTLALGSFITFAFIVLGSALTMKVEYYRLVYEDEATFGKALVAGMADLHLLPGKWRGLDAV